MSLSIQKFTEPFPHLIVRNMYTKEELDLIWQELDFLTYYTKLEDPKSYQGAKVDGAYLSNAKALILDNVYQKREYSNILTVNRKLFTGGFLDLFSELSSHLKATSFVTYDVTKIRYYQNKEYYKSHTDYLFTAIAFSYFYKKPRRFKGGELFFEPYEYEFDCEHNSMILLPGYVKHGVKEITTDEPPFSGESRYCMTQFIAHNPFLLNQ